MRIPFFVGVFIFTVIYSPLLFAGNDAKVFVYFFHMNGCPHCKSERIFLDHIKSVYNENVEIIELEVTKNRKNASILKKVGKELDVKVPGVPFTVIGKKYFVGWDGEEKTGLDIEEALKECMRSPCPDIVSKYLVSISKGSLQNDSIPETISLPLLGEINTKDLSLPLLTIVMAALDGFNPCAMWVLLFLITLLLGIEDKRRRWVLGISFLIISALVYFLFMAAWLNLFLFIGYVVWIRIFVAMIALYASYHYLRQYITNPSGACEVSQGESRQKVFSKIKEVVQKKNFLFALAGIVLLSFSVNLVELICSAGLPAVFTQTLVANNLPVFTYYVYLSLYILVFLLDDIIVFIVAMITLQATGFTTKFTHVSQLIGGILMFIIGILMLFKPEWLMFG